VVPAGSGAPRASSNPRSPRPTHSNRKEKSMQRVRATRAVARALPFLVPANMPASSHREAPITALDHTADVTDWYAFVSFDHPDRVTMILNVDPFLEPSNGPNYFPFDP